MSATARKLFWSRTIRLTALLLLAWLGVNLVVPWFARDLDRVHVLGFPLAYWLAAQGMLLLYLLIIVVYAHRMDRLEAQYRSAERDGETGAEAALTRPANTR